MDFKYIIALFVGIIVEKTIQRINMYLLNAKYKMFLASLSKEDIKLMKQVENDAKEQYGDGHARVLAASHRLAHHPWLFRQLQARETKSPLLSRDDICLQRRSETP